MFAERTLATDSGLPARSARHYEDAVASAVVDVEKVNRSLPDDRRLIVARTQFRKSPFCFSPAGPLTRDELDLVTEHFNPQCLAGLLPNKAVNVGDTWTVAPAAAQAAGQFDGLIKNNLTGKLTAAADGKATFTIEGTMEGIEHGAKVERITINATTARSIRPRSGIVTAFTLEAEYGRSRAGDAVAPASQIREATIALRRAKHIPPRRRRN